MRFFKKSKNLPKLDDQEGGSQEEPITVNLNDSPSKPKAGVRANMDIQDVVVLDVEATTSASTPKSAPLSSTLKSMFRRDAKSTPPPEALGAQDSGTEGDEPSKPKRAAFSFGLSKKESKPETNASDKTEKKPKPVKPGKKTKSTASGQTLVLATEIENGRVIYWQLSAAELTQLEEVPPGATVLSFSKSDLRYSTNGALNDRKAQALALSDVGENVGIVNLTKRFNAVYACRLSKLQEQPYVLIPGVQLFEPEILSRQGDNEQILGAVLSDEASGRSLAILVHINSVGDADAAQVSLNPEDMNFVLSQFMAARKINRAKVQTLIFNNQEVLQLAKDAKAYPSSLLFYGVPVAVLQKLGVSALGMVAACLVGWAGWTWNGLNDLQNQKAALTGQIKVLTAERLNMLSGSMGAITGELTTDTQGLLNQAQSFWVDGALVSVVANVESWEYTVALPLSAGQSMGNTADQSVRPSEQMEALAQIAVPKDCTKSPLLTSNTQNEYKITITCSISRGRFARLIQ